MHIGKGKQGVVIEEYGNLNGIRKDGNEVIGYIEPACDRPKWILYFTNKGDAIIYTQRGPKGAVLGKAIRPKAQLPTGKKCEALKSADGRSWALFKGTEKKYHQCNRPAVIRVVNEYCDLGGPDKIWLCDECDEISKTQ